MLCIGTQCAHQIQWRKVLMFRLTGGSRSWESLQDGEMKYAEAWQRNWRAVLTVMQNKMHWRDLI